MKNEKSSGALLVVLMVIMIVLMCGAFVGLFFMMKQADELKTEISELKGGSEDESNKNEVSGENKQETSSKCKSIVGAYYAEVIEGNLHMKQTYSFSSDGSYVTYVENGGGTNGTYVLSNGTVYLTQKPELGPSNETSTFFYEVSDDCNTIYVRDPYINYDLKKVQQ